MCVCVCVCVCVILYSVYSVFCINLREGDHHQSILSINQSINTIICEFALRRCVARRRKKHLIPDRIGLCVRRKHKGHSRNITHYINHF